MSRKKLRTLTFEMDDGQALAFAQLLKRIGYNDVKQLSSPNRPHEVDEMISAINEIQKAFAEIGFDPR